MERRKIVIDVSLEGEERVREESRLLYSVRRRRDRRFGRADEVDGEERDDNRFYGKIIRFRGGILEC